jgi:predicted ATPase
MACLSYLSWTLWFLGYAGQALERSAEALTLAHALSQPVSLAFAQDFAAALHQLRREVHLTRERAEAAIALSSEQGFQLWLTAGTLYRGWALAELGQREEGTIVMRNGLAAFRATGAKVGQTYFLARLAEAYEKGGQANEGFSVLADALAAADQTEERFYESELYRVKGQLSLEGYSDAAAMPALREAELSFREAIRIAHRQQAKSLELRATMSLARLLAKQDRRDEGRLMLAEIYNWFTEGFDTADLKDAKALLDELRA